MASPAFDPDLALDGVSRQLLRELQENARLSYSELGRRVGLTPPAVAERMRRLEEAGVILGYRADVEPAALGYPLSAFIRVAARERKCNELGEFAKDQPEVLECHRVTGTESYVMKVAVRSVVHLQELIDRLMPYGDTVTSVVLSSTVTHRVLEPPSRERSETKDHAAG